jgi:ribosome biogenesis GTPase
VDVEFEGQMLTCLLSAELAEKQQTEIAVGDRVEIQFKGENAAVVERVLPRRTKLSRPDPGKPGLERVIVANVDVVAVVTSLVSPPLHPRILDRYLIAIRRGGAEAVIVVNKIDLAREEEREVELAKLEPYRRLGLPIVVVSAESRANVLQLRELLKGKISAFVGHSGVGKSSLLNALKPDLGLQAGAVSSGYGRGTHTTTRSTMWDLGEGTRIIDTPGIRSFGLWNLTREELSWYFPEFSEVGRCKFRNCSHVHEPDCAVKLAVQRGGLSPDRYDTYLRILRSI